MVTENTPKYIIDLEKSMNRQFSEVKDEVRETRRLVDNLAIVMKKEFDAIKADIAEIREDITEIREDIAELREDIEEIRQDVEQLQFDVKKLEINVEKIEGHIGRYEIRAQNIELILLEDHKPRIKELERLLIK